MNGQPGDERKTVLIGHISGVHGVKGWVKIHSLTEPKEAIFEYQPWQVGEAREAVRILKGVKHGKHLIAQLKNIENRDQAESLVNQSIAVYRDQFPDLPAEEYYWTDLEGLSVKLEDETELGRVERMLATGANDVMVVRGEKERLIPFVQGQYVKKVNLDDGEIIVDWDPDF
ncbi:MAG: ribosome maturation factor RimM [Xanthomonadales bacterium]|nr:ribosome maturation factor RimM [Gammaproteobacteria bacterium]MBT8053844.1 ribosome maturation factor RimM [Gammaproteobacteria bacterium]NND56425.1 ribosome maturation factor RimM [Xanthomonadales bacterium]NNK51811.1 ribosome maturation factor RimM [Xanthomonadales bacterium]